MRSTSATTRRCSCGSSRRIAAVVVCQEIAQQLGDQALLLKEHRRRPPPFHLLADFGPDLMEVREVADDVFLGAAASGRANDDAPGKTVLLAELAHDAAQPAAFLARIDLPRDADVVDRGHENQEPAGHGDVRCQARALGAERLLHDLDEDVLAFLEEIFDLGFRAIAIAAAGRRRVASAAFGPRANRERRLARRRGRCVRINSEVSGRLRGGFGRRLGHSAGLARLARLARQRRLWRRRTQRDRRLVLVVAGEALELLYGVDDFRDVEEGVALEADVNE